MDNLVIIGNSGAARECHQLFMDCFWASPTLRFAVQFKGFLSYKNFPCNLGPLATSQIDDMDTYNIQPNDIFVIGIGDCAIRASVYATMKGKNAKFMNLISPWSYVPADFQMGEANIINSSCHFSGGSIVGNGNYFNGNVRLGHDVTIGDFNFFAPSTTVLGGASVGNGNLVAVQSTLLEHSKIGNRNYVCPGAIVFKGCKSKSRMAGNPALIIEKGA